ncbi:LysR family transcriptional regulator [Pigmentiphaga soli]|uniref:LysR family transcriptional regulator n=1 Tax=Pigmentiphaga soli TaxID=1007095 RepID=A0ABP8GB90_9BURK
MRRKIPSTAALAAFEAAARHQSFTLAADELAVTQSAVCRQIAALEQFVGVALFRRSRRGVVLTPAGLQYSRSVRARLDDVERDTLEVMAKAGAGGSLDVAVVPTFGTRWLVPRLPAFQRSHPHITIHLQANTRPFLFDETRLDAAIHAGDGRWPGTRARLLMPERLLALGAPQWLAGRGQLAAREVAAMPLLQMSTRPYAWRRWFASQGLLVEAALAGPRMELFSMAMEAAAHGMGAALVPELLAEEELRSGRLVVLASHPFASDLSYYFIHPEHRTGDPALASFGDWLVQQATR